MRFAILCELPRTLKGLPCPALPIVTGSGRSNWAFNALNVHRSAYALNLTTMGIRKTKTKYLYTPIPAINCEASPMLIHLTPASTFSTFFPGLLFLLIYFFLSAPQAYFFYLSTFPFLVPWSTFSTYLLFLLYSRNLLPHRSMWSLMWALWGATPKVEKSRKSRKKRKLMISRKK